MGIILVKINIGSKDPLIDVLTGNGSISKRGCDWKINEKVIFTNQALSMTIIFI